MPRTAPPFAGWGLSMPAETLERYVDCEECMREGVSPYCTSCSGRPPPLWVCGACDNSTLIVFLRRSVGAWLCRGCARAPHTPLGTRWA